MSTQNPYDSICILGPTASGKTNLTVQICQKYGGELLSIDSRMVYKKMDIGTGKDLHEYSLTEPAVNYHLIDIIDAHEPYAIHQFQDDFKLAFEAVRNKNKIPVLCGGSGLYLEAVIKDFTYTSVPNLHELRAQLDVKNDTEIQKIFEQQAAHPFKLLADTSTRKRTIRAIEILQYLFFHPEFILRTPQPIKPLVIGLNPPLGNRRENILLRLQQRINNGLIEEVEQLLADGITHERLVYFGLEYKFVSDYLQGKMSMEYMIEHLGIAIQQFAKRQMTYFRKMEKAGIKIHWIEKKEDAFPLIQSCF